MCGKILFLSYLLSIGTNNFVNNFHGMIFKMYTVTEKLRSANFLHVDNKESETTLKYTVLKN